MSSQQPITLLSLSVLLNGLLLRGRAR